MRLPREGKRRAVRKISFRGFRHRNPTYFKAAKPRSELHAVMRQLFGPAYWRVTAAVLGVSQSQASALMVAGSTPSVEVLERVNAWARKLPAMLEHWREEAVAAIEAEYEARKLEIAGATTEARLQLVRRQKSKALENAAANARLNQARERKRAERVGERMSKAGDWISPVGVRPGRKATRKRPSPASKGD